METPNFTNWDTSALVRLARILKITTSQPGAKAELALVMTELAKRDAISLV